MPLRQAKGNMYEWVSHTWNPIKGRCAHDCSYCYMKRWGKQQELRLDPKEMETDLGKDRFIFVGSGTDIFASDVPEDWIRKVLIRAGEFDNKYLFQTKNPVRYRSFYSLFPAQTVLGTTLETNRDYAVTKAPSPVDRAIAISALASALMPVMVTIEPIMDFDLKPLLQLVRISRAKWVNIGANSRREVRLPEPSAPKIKKLIMELSRFTQVRPKKNLKKLLS